MARISQQRQATTIHAPARATIQFYRPVGGRAGDGAPGTHPAARYSRNASGAYALPAPGHNWVLPCIVRCVQGGASQEAGATRARLHATCEEAGQLLPRGEGQPVPRILPGTTAAFAAEHEQLGPGEALG